MNWARRNAAQPRCPDVRIKSCCDFQELSEDVFDLPILENCLCEHFKIFVKIHSMNFKPDSDESELCDKI